MNNNDKNDIVGAINIMSTRMDGRFDKVEGRLDRVEKDVKEIKATMVTKEYLDDKLADTKGDIKMRELITILREKQVLADDDVKRILSMEPFPQLYV